MTTLTTAQEYDAVRQAIQALESGAPAATVQIGSLSLTYHASRLEWLHSREVELARRLAIRNTLKRTRPDYT